MNNKKVILMFVLVIIALFAAGYMIMALKSNTTETTNAVNAVNITANNESAVNTTISNSAILSNTLNNVVIDNTTTNVISNQNITNTTVTTNSSSNAKQKAMDLAKKAWGSDSTVYFYIDQDKGNGKYVVSVRDNATTEAISWYDVDVNKNTAVEQ